MKQLITRICNKDESALKELYVQYSDSLYGIIMKTVKDKFVAESILQKTFLKIWKKAHLYDENKGTSFMWMSQIARNTSIDNVRLKSYQQKKNIETFNINLKGHDQTSHQSHSIDSTSLLKKLECKYRSVLDKVYLQGYTRKGLAEEMDIPEGTVKSRVRIAIRKLKYELRGETNI